MKEFIVSLVIVSGVVSVTWWVGTGVDPLEQVTTARRHLMSSPFFKRLRVSSQHLFARMHGGASASHLL
jgi:hypothetical protein